MSGNQLEVRSGQASERGRRETNDDYASVREQNGGTRTLVVGLTAAILRGRRLHSVHVGDTRTYRLRDGALTLLTRDHTRDHPDMRHVLIRAVGLEETIRPDYSASDLIPHDRYLLCS